MRVFLTGATGYIGAAVTEKLIAAGHHVAGLARSEASARALERLGAEAARGGLEDPPVISAAARAADAVIHLAFAPSADAPRLDRLAVDTILSALAGSGKPFLYTSGVWVMGNTGGHVADEATPVNPTALVAWRPPHEQLVLNAKGVRGIVIRPGMVYGRGGGLVGRLFRPDECGVVHYIGTGENRWSFIHVDDLADLYVLALQAPAGSLYFAVAGPAVAISVVAQAAAHGAPVEGIPLEVARQSMGEVADALALDCMVSARKAMAELGWKPGARPVLEEFAQQRG
jgi:nucleoside-diphosphate-sugar epimerase